MARLEYVEKEQAPESVRQIYETLEQEMGVVPNLNKMFAHRPEILEGMGGILNAVLQDGVLDPQIREIATLVVTKINGCRYCTGHHLRFAKQAGVPQEKMDALPDAPSDLFDEKDRAVIAYAAEVTRNVAASENTFNDLKNHFNESEIVELTFVIGLFNLLTRFADTLKVDLEKS